ncbi:alpha/beta fold hydrolase [Rhodonellum sp.]|uniref:alpha/beta fold hydrolase n=1 Tax=Rhodonellum sp. TaxID=2231180 RepID=UPI002718379E|nr:alpha/beta hydrolase [Rhodonellum sp.]MDO9552858.1 alpha/beta hydrolase [Rhodonellum sp.]
MKKILKIIFGIFLILTLLVILTLIGSYRKDISPEILVEKYADQNSFFLKVNGLNVHVKIKGEGEPIFLIHGSFSSLHTWEAWEKELSPYFMTISMDLPGHGLTGPDPGKGYGISDYSALVFGIADQLDLDEFHVAGNSMGGGVALKMASDHPERILSLNLIDASFQAKQRNSGSQKPSGNLISSITKLAQNPIFSNLLLKCTPKFIFRMNMEQVFFDQAKIKEESVTRYYELIRREGNRQATIDRLTTRKSYEIDFERLKMPVLIMWGKEDRWIPLERGKQLAADIPGAKLKVFEQAGHVPMEEIPTETVREYLSFLGIQLDMDYFSAPKYLSYVP